MGETWEGLCVLCGRVEESSRHHLIPRSRHKNKRTKAATTPAERHQTVGLCPPCHDQVHALFTEKELADTYNTVPLLAAHPDVAAWVTWIASKPVGFRPANRRSGRRRG